MNDELKMQADTAIYNHPSSTPQAVFAIVVNGVTKTYDEGKVLAVNNISLTIHKGELFGLIGPDGAGKTSLFRILTTLLLADKGTASVDGLDVVKDYQAIRN